MREPIRPWFCAMLSGTRPGASGPSGSASWNTRLSASGGVRLSRPRSDRLVGEPDRQAAALTGPGVISRPPVRDLALLARYVVSAGLVQLERQGKHPRSEEGRPVHPNPALSTNRPADPCNTASRGAPASWGRSA